MRYDLALWLLRLVAAGALRLALRFDLPGQGPHWLLVLGSAQAPWTILLALVFSGCSAGS